VTALDGTRGAVGRAIKAAREAKGWTQAEVFVQLGCRPETFNNWEHGLSSVGWRYRDRLGDLLGLDIRALQRGD